MKLTVEYDPMVGYVCKDGEAQGWVDDVLHAVLKRMNDKDQYRDDLITVASALLIDYFRVRLAEGVIKKDQIAFKFDGKILEHNEHGRITHWPKGFCDLPIEPMERLLTLQSEAWKKEKPLRDAKTAAMKERLRKKITTIVPCKECHEHPCACSLLEDNELTGLQDISWKKN